MKKFLVFVLVLVSACAVFADQLPAEKHLNVYLTIGPDSAAKWGDDVLSLDNWDSNETTGETFTSSSQKIDVYPSVKTNEGPVKMTVTGAPLAKAGISTKIGLTAAADVTDNDVTGNKKVDWTSLDSSSSIIWEENEENATGLRVYSKKLTLSVNVDDYKNALATNYQATLKLCVELQSE